MQPKGIDLLLRAFDVSLDWRKLGFAMLGFIAIGIITRPFVWIMEEVRGVVESVFFLIMLVVIWILWTFISGTVSKLSYEDLRGRKVGLVDAMSFVAQRMLSLLISPLVLWFGIGVVILIELILLLFGRVPFLGELFASALFLPLFVVNFFLLLLALLGSWLIPFIVIGEGIGIFDALSRLVDIVRHAPGRIMFYLGMTLLLVVLAVLPIYLLASGAISLTAGLHMIGLGGRKLGRIMYSVAEYLPMDFFLLVPPLTPYAPLEKGRFTFLLAGWIYSLSLAAIIGFIAAFFIVFPLSCGCAIYMSVREEVPAEAIVKRAVRRYCISCGAEIAPKARFCIKCGAPQSTR
jgi:hypothetical protein